MMLRIYNHCIKLADFSPLELNVRLSAGHSIWPSDLPSNTPSFAPSAVPFNMPLHVSSDLPSGCTSVCPIAWLSQIPWSIQWHPFLHPLDAPSAMHTTACHDVKNFCNQLGWTCEAYIGYRVREACQFGAQCGRGPHPPCSCSITCMSCGALLQLPIS